MGLPGFDGQAIQGTQSREEGDGNYKARNIVGRCGPNGKADARSEQDTNDEFLWDGVARSAVGMNREHVNQHDSRKNYAGGELCRGQSAHGDEEGQSARGKENQQQCFAVVAREEVTLAKIRAVATGVEKPIDNVNYPDGPSEDCDHGPTENFVLGMGEEKGPRESD